MRDSAHGVCFGPNLGSVDYLQLFQEPDSWANLRGRISGFKLYGDNLRALEPGEFGCGPNTYLALREAGAFDRLTEWDLPIHLETGAVKDWDPDGSKLTADVLDLLARVAEAGASVDIVSMDEPLTSTVMGADSQDVSKLGPECAGDIARYAARWAARVQDMGPRVALIEAYPYHPAPRICGFLRDIVCANHIPLAFFELDLDLFGIRDQRLSPGRVKADMDLIRLTCHELEIPFRAIVTALRATTPGEYRDGVASLCDRLARLGPWDGVTVQSWATLGDRGRELPRNFPVGVADSHLSVLQAVLDRGLV